MAFYILVKPFNILEIFIY